MKARHEFREEALRLYEEMGPIERQKQGLSVHSTRLSKSLTVGYDQIQPKGEKWIEDKIDELYRDYLWAYSLVHNTAAYISDDSSGVDIVSMSKGVANKIITTTND